MDLDNTAEFLEDIRVTRQAKRRSAPKSAPKKAAPDGTNVSLVCWRLNFKRHQAGTANGRGLFPDVSLCVEGVRIDDGNHWASSEIVERVGPRLVRTTNTAYHLIGKMESRISLERGFPKEVIERFANGFPDDWHEVLSRFVAFGKHQYENRREFLQSQLQTRPTSTGEPNERRSPRKRPASSESPEQTPRKRRSHQTADEFLTSDDSPPFRPPNATDGSQDRRQSQSARMMGVLPEDDDASFDVAWPSDASFPEDDPEDDSKEKAEDGAEGRNANRTEVPQTPPAAIRSAPTDTPSANTRSARRRRAEERSGRMDSMADTRTPSPPPPAANPRKKKGRRTGARDSDFFDPPTPVLNRSRSGRLLKPRLAPGERIVYNSAGSPIEVRRTTTRTHLSNGNSQNLNAIAKQLSLSKPETPKQRERRLEPVRPAAVAKNSTRRPSRTALERLLAYESDETNAEEENRTRGRSDAELTPLPVRRPKAPIGRRRVMFSDDEEKEKEEEEVIERKKRKPKRQNTTSASIRSKKSGRTKATNRTTSKAANRTAPPRATRRRVSDGKTTTAKKKKPVASARRSSLPVSKTTRTPRGRRKSAASSDEDEADESGATAEVENPKPKEKKWGKREKEDLQTAFRLYNPLEEGDWRDLVACLPLDWTVDEVKTQAAAMKLRPIRPVGQRRPQQSTQLVDRIKKCMANGKLPTKGTIRREQFEEAVGELVMQLGGQEDADDTLNDMEDSFFEEAIRAHALDESLRPTATQRIVTPSKRTFFPQVVSACRRRSSLAAIEAVGDDFSMPDRSKMVRYRHQYRAQQFNRRFGGNQRPHDPEREVFDLDEEEAENDTSGFSRIEEEEADETTANSTGDFVQSPPRAAINARLPLPPPRSSPVDTDTTVDRAMIDVMFD